MGHCLVRSLKRTVQNRRNALRQDALNSASQRTIGGMTMRVEPRPDRATWVSRHYATDSLCHIIYMLWRMKS